MKYIGNYKDWIKDEWISEAVEVDGYRIPYDFFKDDTIANEEAAGQREHTDPSEKKIYEVYGTQRTFFHLLESGLLSFDIGNPPWLKDNRSVNWWITKMYPGEYIPVHQDILKEKDPHTERYWMPLLDYSPGHIFMYHKTGITSYQAGDVFLYEDPREWHGAINLGSTVRLVMQVTLYNPKKNY